MSEFIRCWSRTIGARLAICVGIVLLVPAGWLGRSDSISMLLAADPPAVSRDRVYELALADPAGDAAALLKHGYQALKEQNYTQAITDATRALELDHNLALGYMLRGYAYTASGREVEASADYRQIVRLDPKNETAIAALNELVNGWPLVISDELVRPMIENGSLIPDDPSLASLMWFPPMPGSQNDLQPVGGTSFNVLKHVIFNRQTGALKLVGEIDPRWPTGPIPYLEFLQAGWSSSGPEFSLEPGPGEMERVNGLLQGAMRDLSWVTKLLRRAIQDRGSPGLEALVQTNFRLDEATLASLRSQLTQANKSAATAEIIRRCHELMLNEGLVLPQQILDTHGGFNTFNELRFAKVPTDSQLARVLFESDYGLKYVINSPLLARQIKGFETRAQFVRRRDPKLFSQSDQIRYWFKIQGAPVRLADDGNRVIISFETPQIAINAVRYGQQGDTRVPVYAEYAKQLTAQYDQIARWLPEWHELREAVKVLAMVRMLNRQKISLQFPAQTLNPWTAPRRVSPVLTANLFENPGGVQLSTYTNVVAVSGGVDLANVGDRINLTGLRDEQIKSIGSFFDSPSDAVEAKVVPLVLTDASTVDLRSLGVASTVENLTVPLLRGANDRGYRVPPLAQPPPPVGMVGKEDLDRQLRKLSVAQLRRQLTDLDRQLRGLNQSVLNNQDELDRWVKEVEDAQRDALFRIPDVLFGWVGYESLRYDQADRRELDLLSVKFRQTADPAARQKILDEIKPLVKDMKLLRSLSRSSEGGERISEVADWIEKFREKLNDVQEKKKPEVGAKDFEFAVRQVLGHLDRFKLLVKYSPLIHETNMLGQVYIDTIYDLGSEYTAWKLVQEMDHNEPAYRLAVSESQRRIVAIINELHKRDAHPPSK